QASDVYSLGVVMYECVAKKRPFDGPDLIGVITEVIEGAQRARLDDPLGALIERMIAREPGKRPALAEVVAAVRPALPKRSRWPFVAFAAGVVALAGGAYYITTRKPAKVL